MEQGARMIRRQLMIGLAAVLTLTGCIDVDYVGQDFPPLPEKDAVQFFDEKNPVPAGGYQPIGHATLTVPSGYGNVEVREKMAEIAREHGASAVRIVSVKQRQVNRYYEREGESAAPALAGRDTVGAFARQPDGSATEVNSFGEVVSPNRSYSVHYERVVKIMLLLPEAAYQRAVAERKLAAQEK